PRGRLRRADPGDGPTLTPENGHGDGRPRDGDPLGARCEGPPSPARRLEGVRRGDGRLAGGAREAPARRRDHGSGTPPATIFTLRGKETALSRHSSIDEVSRSA